MGVIKVSASGVVGSIYGFSEGTDGKKGYVRFSVGCAPRVKNGNGDWVNGNTTWLNATVFGKQAEYCSEKLEKGMPVELSGTLEYVEFERKDGTTGSALQVKCDNVSIPLVPWVDVSMKSKSKGASKSSFGGGAKSARAVQNTANFDSGDSLSDDFTFDSDFTLGGEEEISFSLDGDSGSDIDLW